MKLVSAHKPLLILLFSLFGFTTVQAQVWALQQSVDTAQVHNKNLCVAQSSIPIGEQNQKVVKANLLPKIILRADHQFFSDLPHQLMSATVFGCFEAQFKEAPFDLTQNIITNFEFATPLYEPQLYGAIKSNEIVSEFTESKSFITEEEALFEIPNLYFTAQTLRHQLAFITNNLANTQLLKEQFPAKGIDLNKVELQIAWLTAQKEELSNQYQKIINTLAFALDINIEDELQVESPIQSQSFFEFKSLPTIDSSLARMQHLLLPKELNTLNRVLLLPSVNLFDTYGTSEFGFDEMPYDFLKYYPFSCAGIQFSDPLFNGTATQRKKFELRKKPLHFDLFTLPYKMNDDNSKIQPLVYRQSIEPTTTQFELPETIYEQNLPQQLVYRYDKETPINVWEDTIQLEDFNAEWLYSGALELNVKTKLSANIQGKANEVFVDVADIITKGQTQVQLGNTLLKLQLQSIEVQIEALVADTKNYTELAKTDAVQKVQPEKSELCLKLTKVHKATLLAQINKTTIKAPFSDIISAKLTEQGAFSGLGVPFLQITDISKLKFAINVPGVDLSNFSHDERYNMSVYMYPNIPLPENISSIGRDTNMGRSFPIQFTLNNTANLNIKSGLPNKAHIQNVIEEGVASVPSSLLIGTIQRPQVYLIVNDKSLLQSVSISQIAGSNAIISNGLKEGDAVIIQNCITELCKPHQ